MSRTIVLFLALIIDVMYAWPNSLRAFPNFRPSDLTDASGITQVLITTSPEWPNTFEKPLPNDKLECAFHPNEGLRVPANWLNSTAIQCDFTSAFSSEPNPNNPFSPASRIEQQISLYKNGNESYINPYVRASFVTAPMLTVSLDRRPYFFEINDVTEGNALNNVSFLVHIFRDVFNRCDACHSATALRFCLSLKDVKGSAKECQDIPIKLLNMEGGQEATRISLSQFKTTSLEIAAKLVNVNGTLIEDLEVSPALIFNNNNDDGPETVVSITNNVMSDSKIPLSFLPKIVKLVIAPPSNTKKSFFVDHTRRAILINNGNSTNNKPLVLNGFYTSILEYLSPGKKPNPRTNKPWTLQDILDEITGLAMQGINFMEVYPRSSTQNVKDIQNYKAVMDHLAKLKMYASFNLIDVILPLIEGKGTSPKDWDQKLFSDLEQLVMEFQSHPAILGWYICDDCNDLNAGKNKKMWDRQDLSNIYNWLKAKDPYHLILGATFKGIGSGEFAEEAAYGRILDAQQIENYVEEPYLHFRNLPVPQKHQGDIEAEALQKEIIGQGDAIIRSQAGLYFESLINSGPMFLLDNPEANDGGTTGHLKFGWSPKLESTLSWASVIAYNAVGQLNFAWDPPTIGDNDHVSSQANYRNAAKQIASALFPDLTKKQAFKASSDIDTTTFCSLVPAAQQKGVQQGEKAIGKDAVFVKGYSQTWNEDGFCGFVIAVNGCNHSIETEIIVENVPDNIQVAQRIFGGPYYNITLEASNNGERRMQVDIDSYDTTILSLGCDGWKPLQ
eukprot:g795.t1